MNDLEHAKELLINENLTCVLCCQEQVYTSIKKGIQPMVDFLTQGISLEGFSAADKIVGKAAAMLFALAKVKEVHAQVLSKTAATVLEQYHIAYTYEILTESIINRSGSGLCPMEQAVEEAARPEDAFTAIKETLHILKNKERV